MVRKILEKLKFVSIRKIWIKIWKLKNCGYRKIWNKNQVSLKIYDVQKIFELKSGKYQLHKFQIKSGNFLN